MGERSWWPKADDRWDAPFADAATDARIHQRARLREILGEFWDVSHDSPGGAAPEQIERAATAIEAVYRD